LKRHPEHTLDTTLRLRDLGKSAFRGKNLDKDKGDLGKFIALAAKGDIPKGSILMLEGWDRFSRMPPFKAARVFGDLVEAGVSVLTLSPEQLIDDTNIDNMEVVLPVVIGMQLTHEESRKKSQRIKAKWKEFHEKAAKDGTAWGKRCPCWLYRDGDKWKVKDGAAKTLRYIFRRTTEGIGARRLLGELNAKHKPFTKRGYWYISLLSNILKDRAVLGEANPQRRSDKPLPAIVGYYPQVIDETTWYKARAAIEGRKTAKGRSGLFVNLFVSLVKFPDGFNGVVQTTTGGKGGKTARRLVSVGHRDKVSGACPLVVEYFKAERYLLAMLYQLKPSDLFPAKSGKTANGLREKERELAGMAARLAELEAALGDTRQPVPQLVAAITDLTTRQDALRGQIERLRQTEATATSKPLEAAQGLLETLDGKPEAERHDLRLKLRGLIADLVERVDLEPYRAGRQVEARITLHCRNALSVETDTGGFKGVAGNPSEDQILSAIHVALRHLAADEKAKPTARKGKRKG
jgi:hypothetical protein